MNPSRRRLLVEQIVAVAVLEYGMKVDAMWHVPQWHRIVYIVIFYQLAKFLLKWFNRHFRYNAYSSGREHVIFSGTNERKCKYHSYGYRK